MRLNQLTASDIRLAALDRGRASYLPTWQELSAHFAPRRGCFSSAARGQRRDQKLIDSTPLIAARVMATGMMAGISGYDWNPMVERDLDRKLQRSKLTRMACRASSREVETH